MLIQRNSIGWFFFPPLHVLGVKWEIEVSLLPNMFVRWLLLYSFFHSDEWAKLRIGSIDFRLILDWFDVILIWIKWGIIMMMMMINKLLHDDVTGLCIRRTYTRSVYPNQCHWRKKWKSYNIIMNLLLKICILLITLSLRKNILYIIIQNIIIQNERRITQVERIYYICTNR
jgi:hypothetical protein